MERFSSQPEDDPDRLLAALAWQIDLGADEAIGETPVNRFDAAPEPLAKQEKPKVESVPAEDDPADMIDQAVGAAQMAALAADDLGALRSAMSDYPHCALKKGARKLVFADGDPAARVMIVGEAPGREEDMQGLPFVGAAGQMLDRMLAAIGLSRRAADPRSAVYITNVLPWRPPQNRDPSAAETAMMLPFLRRHVELAAPEILVLMGNSACHALLGRGGITRLNGVWTECLGRPALPMLHPAYLLRTPEAKREAWAALLQLNHRLKGNRDVEDR